MKELIRKFKVWLAEETLRRLIRAGFSESTRKAILSELLQHGTFMRWWWPITVAVFHRI